MDPSSSWMSVRLQSWAQITFESGDFESLRLYFKVSQGGEEKRIIVIFRWGVSTLRGSGGLPSPSGSRAKPGRGSGRRSPPEAEAVLQIQYQNVFVKMMLFLTYYNFTSCSPISSSTGRDAIIVISYYY